MIVAVIEMHQLDELEDKVSVTPYKSQEVIDLVIVDPGEDHHVEFYRGKAGPERCIDPGKHIAQPVATGDPLAGPGVQAVKADVDPAEAGLFEVLGHTRKQHAVCCDGRLDPLGNRPDYVENIRPDKWFSPGKLDTPDPELCGDVHDPDNLFRAHISIRVFLPFGMAVDTGKIAPGGETDAEVGHRSSVRILKRRCHWHFSSAFEVLCDDVNFRAPLAGCLRGVCFHRVEVLFYHAKEFGEVRTLERFDHEVAAGL